MAEPEQKVGSETEGTPNKEATQEQTVPMSAYKTLQRDVQKTKDRIKELEAKVREGESVEQALAREKADRESLEKELKVLRVKGEAPKELHGLIDNFVTKYGVVPDEDDLELLKSAAPAKQEETPRTPPSTTSSGVRNAGAGKPRSGADMTDDELRRIKLSDIA